MPLDAQMKAFLDKAAERRTALNIPPLETMPLEFLRTGMRPLPEFGTPEEVAAVEDRTIPGPGGELPIRIYVPSVHGPSPALVYFHGGGHVAGGLDLVPDVLCRAMANRAACIVVSVGYRLAPEHKFPAAVEDAYAATRWVHENATTIAVDSSRLAVGGDSAGGNLSAVVCLQARERGGPLIAFQMLLYPDTILDFRTASWAENDGYGLTRAFAERCYGEYVRDDTDRINPHAAPLLAPDLSGLPPALMVTAEFDPLRDEGEAYAGRLSAAGVRVTVRRYEGMIHGFLNFSGAVERARLAIDELGAELREALA
jgi:acetyl esterase